MTGELQFENHPKAFMILYGSCVIRADSLQISPPPSSELTYELLSSNSGAGAGGGGTFDCYANPDPTPTTHAMSPTATDITENFISPSFPQQSRLVYRDRTGEDVLKRMPVTSL
jgi:hypothetical protein